MDATGTLPQHIVDIIFSALIFLDTDVAYGPQDARTLTAKAALREAFAAAGDVDPPQLSLIKGGEG